MQIEQQIKNAIALALNSLFNITPQARGNFTSKN